MKPLDELAPGEELVDDPDELLWRQVNPDWVSGDGIPTSQAFKPATADENKPSFARASVHTAEQAYVWHTQSAGLRSIGTWGVTVSECTSAQLRVVDDSRAADAPATRSPAHAYADFRPMSKSERKAAAASLLTAALRRQQIYRPA